MELERAKQIVSQFFNDAQDPTLEDLLEASKGSDYRPYYVAGFLIYSDYQQLVKADEVTFAYDKLFAVQSLMNMQKNFDCSMSDIPECHTVDHFVNGLTGFENNQSDGSGYSFSTFGM